MNAIGRARAVMLSQAFELPIRIRDHIDAAIAIHQDRQIAVLRPPGVGSGEKLFGVLKKYAHRPLIAQGVASLSARPTLFAKNRLEAQGIPAASEENSRGTRLRCEDNGSPDVFNRSGSRRAALAADVSLAAAPSGPERSRIGAPSAPLFDRRRRTERFHTNLE